MNASKSIPIALTVAGSDSGGGAGIQADLKTFEALGVHGVAALTCLTAQNPRKVSSIQAAKTQMVRAQLAAIFQELPPRAAKTGMLFSPSIIRTVTEWFKLHREVPLVVDPVMISTSHASLLQKQGLRRLRDELLPLATLVTPNLNEAAALTDGKPLRSVEDMRRAARQIHNQCGSAILIKGGHLGRGKEAIDIYFDGATELLLTAPFIRGVSTHGTGCTYSAAIVAYLARGFSLDYSLRGAKEYITQAIARSRRISGHQVLRHNFA